MKTSCLINNFNYGDFVVDSVKSVLNQTIEFDEIIVVDDYSTDQSRELLKNNFSDHSKVKLILKETNAGQLSAFNEGYLASTGDIIFFLDSDDLYNPTYLEKALNFYQKNPVCDFLFCAYENFGTTGVGLPPHDSIGVFKKYDSNRDLGYSVVSTLYSPKWIGAITSAISMKRDIARKILPIPFLEDWRGRADDCLLWGAAIAGARRCYLSDSLILRRIHGSNYVMKEINKQSFYIRQLRINRLFEFFRQRMSYGPDLLNFASIEFTTIPNPTSEEFKLYIGLVMSSNIPIHKKIGKIRFMLSHFQNRRG